MTTPADVVDAAIPMASGSRMERARAGLRALGLFGQLSAADKRDLAVLVAQRVAPELVPRIQSEGGIDLTDEQSRAVLDMVRRLDGDDLRELSEAVATPESRRRALASVGGAAAGATGLDDVVTEPRPEPRPEPRSGSRPEPRPETRAAPRAEVDEDTERLRIQVEALQRQSDELRDELAEHEAARRAAESARAHAERELEDARGRLDEATERADREVRAAEQAVADRRAMEERLGRARDRAAARPGATPPAAAPDTGDPATATPVVVPVTTRGDEVDRLVRRLRDVRASQAQRLVVLAAPSVAGMERADRRRTLEAVPDGWARQRTLQRLVEAGAVPRDEAADLLGLLGSTGCQAFAAGTMLETGLVGADDLVDVLEPGAVVRLRRRAGRS